ncbi:hypothetical protein LJC46_04330 [Desulfovibrio sp. OttesenSCG-928-G15]|nr:hypothetical protein [Desulfovibrio sp. OttesenSCG-928-G15]
MDDQIDESTTPEVEKQGEGEQQADSEKVEEQQQTTPDWTESLPESLRDIAKGAGSLEKLESALKHGIANVPVSGVEEIDLKDFGGDDAKWFTEAAVKSGLSSGQINGLVQAFAVEKDAFMERQRIATEKSLKAHYGESYAEKLAIANDTVRRFNDMSGGAFDPILEAGLGNNEAFIRAMVTIAESVSDSSLPGFGAGAGGDAAMSTEAFIKETFNGA